MMKYCNLQKNIDDNTEKKTEKMVGICVVP